MTEYTALDDYRVRTDYILLRKGDSLHISADIPSTLRNGIYVIEYDTNKTYTGSSGGYVTEYTALDDCYVRLVMRYQAENVYIDNVSVFDNTAYLLRGKAENAKKYSGDFVTYHKPTYSGITGNAVATLQTSDIYDRLDALVALHSDEMSRNLLGYATKADGTQNTDSPIYEYVISAQTADRGKTMFTPDTILLSAGIHGDEKSPVVALVELCEKIFNVDDDAYNTLRNFNLKIVPVISPYGFDHTTRYNARGVNLNRNFAYKWDVLSDSAKGSAPYSEYETQAIRDWLADNSNACMYIDYHNTGYELPNVSYLNTPNSTLWNVYTSFIRTVTATWAKRFFPTRTGQTLGFLENNEWPTTYNEAYYEDEIENSMILEVAWGDDDTHPNSYTYTNNIMVMALEQLLNFTRAIISHF